MKTNIFTIIFSVTFLLLSSGAVFAQSNNQTGANSTNYANEIQKDNLIVNNNNNLSFDNLLNLLFNTGGNSASYNTGSGKIVTGSVKAKIVVNSGGNNITNTIGGRGGGTPNPSNPSVTPGRGGGSPSSAPIQIAAANTLPTTLPVAGASDAFLITLLATLALTGGYLVGGQLRRAQNAILVRARNR
ncbi:MAG: hypothetical protein WC437_03355 [Patescibacteria group bacterium]|nr:hypothetical protein [Patescibacteria group bacterium]